MDKKELEERTRKFAVAVVFFVGGLPRGLVSDVLGRQLLRSGTSMGANYREANRAESKSDFIHKIAIVEKESSETVYWLELFEETRIGSPEKLRPLLKDAGELLAIFTSTLRTLKGRPR